MLQKQPGKSQVILMLQQLPDQPVLVRSAVVDYRNHTIQPLFKRNLRDTVLIILFLQYAPQTSHGAVDSSGYYRTALWQVNQMVGTTPVKTDCQSA